MSVEIPEREKLYRLMRNLRPAAVVVVCEDGESTPIALPSGKGRWENAAEAVESMRDVADRVELRNADGAVLRVWKFSDRPRFQPPPEVDVTPAPASPVTTDPLDAQLARMEGFALRIVDVLERSNAAAVARYVDGLGAVMQQALGLMSTVADQNRELLAQHGSMLATLYDATVARGEAEVALTAADNARAEAEEKGTTDAMVKEIAEKVGGQAVEAAVVGMVSKLAPKMAAKQAAKAG